MLLFLCCAGLQLRMRPLCYRRRFEAAKSTRPARDQASDRSRMQNSRAMPDSASRKLDPEGSCLVGHKRRCSSVFGRPCSALSAKASSKLCLGRSFSWSGLPPLRRAAPPCSWEQLSRGASASCRAAARRTPRSSASCMVQRSACAGTAVLPHR